MKFKMADLSSAVPRIAILVEFNYENLEVTSSCRTPHHACTYNNANELHVL